MGRNLLGALSWVSDRTCSGNPDKGKSGMKPRARNAKPKRRVRNGKPYGQLQPPSMLIAGVPAEVRIAFRDECKRQGKQMRDVLVTYMQDYAIA